jgi:twitching motility two-component system response regulator PilH
VIQVIDLARRIDPLPSILIVDGDADTRMLHRTLLTAVARTILEAEDGVEALRAAVCTQPDVILTETRLGRIDGYTLCRYLRRERLTRSVAIVAANGAASPADIARRACRCRRGAGRTVLAGRAARGGVSQLAARVAASMTRMQ